MTITPTRLLLSATVCLLFAVLNIAYLRLQLDSVRAERDQVMADRDAVIRVANTTAERLATATANDTKHTQELSDALKRNQELRDSVRAGGQRLLVHASCPTGTNVRADAGAGGVADAGSAELSADARPDYFTLLDQLALSQQMILGLQDHIRSFCTYQPTPGAIPHDRT